MHLLTDFKPNWKMMLPAAFMVLVFVMPHKSHAQWIQHSIASLDGALAVRAADINGDDQMDVLAASYDLNSVHWYANSGNGSFQEYTIATDYTDALDLIPADLDGDGDIDIVGAAFGIPRVSWFENLGDNNFTEHTIDDDFGGPRRLAVDDVDNDGDIDVAAVGISGGFSIWENLDDGASWDEHVLPAPLFYYNAWGVALGDIDGDGDIDLAGCESGSGRVFWWENTPGNWQYELITNIDDAVDVHIDDMDGDGDGDVVVAGFTSNSVTILQYDEDGWQSVPVTPFFPGPNDVCTGDIDGDGNVDIATAGYAGNQVVFWLNPDGPGYWNENMLSTEFGATWNVELADMDGDTDLDILASAFGAGLLAWWEQPGSPNPVQDNDKPAYPSQYRLCEAYPNPFNPTTQLSVDLPQAAELTVTVFNITGQQVTELANGQYAAGTHSLTFDAASLAGGVYFVHATVPGELNAVQKIVLMK